MFGILRNASKSAVIPRAFSTSAARRDLAKLTLIGRLIKEPELRTTKNEKEFVTYTVVTNTYLPPLEGSHERRQTSTFHKILCFQPSTLNYLQTLRKGSLVYVETNFELKNPEPDADPSTPQGQRQIFLRHESIRVLSTPRPREEPESE